MSGHAEDASFDAHPAGQDMGIAVVGQVPIP